MSTHIDRLFHMALRRDFVEEHGADLDLSEVPLISIQETIAEVLLYEGRASDAFDAFLDAEPYAQRWENRVLRYKTGIDTV